MNKKLSGAQMVLVPITQMGYNKFPFLENLNKRFIKHIDFCPTAYLPDTDAAGCTSSANMFVTITDNFGSNQIIRELPLERLDYTQTIGIRQIIGSKISLSDCYINCQNAAMVGKTAAFVLWYDLEEFSRRNTTDNLSVDSLSIPLTNSVRYNALPDNDRMSGKRFRRIMVATPSTTPDYQPGVAAATLPNLYLTLRKGSYNVCEYVPLPLLYQLQMLEKSEFMNICFDFQSSYITIGGAGTIPSVQTDYIGKSVFLNFEFEN